MSSTSTEPASVILPGHGHEEYHSLSGRPYVTAHLLMRYMEGGIESYLEQIATPRKASPAQAFGSAFHLLMESEQKFLDSYHRGGEPINPRTDKPYGRETKKFEEYQAQFDKPLLMNWEVELLYKMRSALFDLPITRQLTSDGAYEVCVRGILCGLPCQSLVDFIRKPGYAIIDFKTCADLNEFNESIIAYQYDIQMAFYRALFRKVRGVEPPVFLLAVDKQEQPAAAAFRLSDNRLYESENKVTHYLSLLKKDLENSR